MSDHLERRWLGHSFLIIVSLFHSVVVRAHTRASVPQSYLREYAFSFWRPECLNFFVLFLPLGSLYGPSHIIRQWGRLVIFIILFKSLEGLIDFGVSRLGLQLIQLHRLVFSRHRVFSENELCLLSECDLLWSQFVVSKGFNIRCSLLPDVRIVLMRTWRRSLLLFSSMVNVSSDWPSLSGKKFVMFLGKLSIEGLYFLVGMQRAPFLLHYALYIRGFLLF